MNIKHRVFGHSYCKPFGLKQLFQTICPNKSEECESIQQKKIILCKFNKNVL